MRNSSVEVISAYRATSIIDTPMRKVELLEAADGMIILRATSYQGQRADVSLIWLERPAALALGRVLVTMDDEERTVEIMQKAAVGD